MGGKAVISEKRSTFVFLKTVEIFQVVELRLEIHNAVWYQAVPDEGFAERYLHRAGKCNS